MKSCDAIPSRSYTGIHQNHHDEDNLGPIQYKDVVLPV